jgi:hypothetical protein
LEDSWRILGGFARRSELGNRQAGRATNAASVTPRRKIKPIFAVALRSSTIRPARKQ